LRASRLARPEVLKANPYELEQPTFKGRGKTVRLNMNENLLVPVSLVRRLITEAYSLVDSRLYPAPYAALATNALSDFLNVSASRVFVGNGLDDVIDKLTRALLSPKSSLVAIVEPTFVMYRYYAQICGARILPVYLNPDFSLDVKKLLAKCSKASLLFLCSPNNPTGNQFAMEDVQTILEKFDGLLVLDEAYVEYSNGSLVNLTNQFDNLAVLRTFSKAFGLAGLRAGYVVADREIVDILRRTSSPFSVGSLTQQVIVSAIRNWDYFRKSVQLTIEERTRLLLELSKIDGIRPYPSRANFILFRITKHDVSSSHLERRLAECAIVVKDRGSLPLLRNCLRVSVGTRRMNTRFLSRLKTTLEE